MSTERHSVIRRAAKRAGLRCGRSTTVVEVIKGPAIELGERTAVLCIDPKSPTGSTAVINYHGRVVFLPFGRRRDANAWVVPRFLAHSAARLSAEARRRLRTR